MQIDGTLCDGQANTTAARVGRTALVDLVERLEQSRKCVIRYTRTGIVNRQLDGIADLCYFDHDRRTRLSKAHRISHDVLDCAVYERAIDI